MALTQEIRKMYPKDSYLMLLNLVITKEDWTLVKQGTYANVEWDEKIEDKFRGFLNWPKLLRKEEPFLRRLFYGANLNVVDQAESLKYLTLVFFDFFLFLTENIYYSNGHNFTRRSQARAHEL